MAKEGKNMNIYDFTIRDENNQDVSLSRYQGKVLLIVNTATHCGFTPTYQDLEALYKKYRDQGFELLDFPCNQFGGQAPEEIKEISSFCSLTYGTTFPRFAKIEVNGENAIPLYRYLESQKGFAGFDKSHKLAPVLEEINEKADPDWAEKPSIKWNFTKFLIGRDGRVIARFEPTTATSVLADAIEAALNEKAPEKSGGTASGRTKADTSRLSKPITALTLAMMDGCSHCRAAELALKKYGIAFAELNWNTKEGKEAMLALGIEKVPVLLVPENGGLDEVGGQEEIVKWAKEHTAK
jgi:Glutathione peroxidase